MLTGTNLTLRSKVDQDKYGKVTKTCKNTTHKRPKQSILSQQVTTKLQGTDKTAFILQNYLGNSFRGYYDEICCKIRVGLNLWFRSRCCI